MPIDIGFHSSIMRLHLITTYMLRKIGIVFVVLMVFTFFLSLYLVLALYLEGRTITPGGEVVETGIIRLNDLPVGTNVELDGVPISLQTEQIRNVSLGKRSVEAQLEGFIPWEKELRVSDTRVYNLYPKLYPVVLPESNIIAELRVDVIERSTLGNSIYYATSSSAETAGIWEVSENVNFISNSVSNELLIPFTSEFTDEIEGSAYEFKVDPSKRSALITLSEKVYIVNSTGDYFNLAEALGFLPKAVSWLGNDDSLLIESEGILFDYTISTGETKVLYYKPNDSFPYAQSEFDTVYVWNETSNALQKYDSGRVSTVPISSELIIENVENVFASTESDNVAILQTATGLHYFDFFDNVSIFLPGVTNILDISPNGKVILVEGTDSTMSIEFEESLRRAEESNNFRITMLPETITEPAPLRNDLLIGRNLATNELVISDSDGTNRYVIEDTEESTYESFLYTESNLRFIRLVDSNGATRIEEIILGI